MLTTLSHEGLNLKVSATHNEDGNEAGQGGVPVTIGRSLAHQHAVENEVSQTKLHTTWNQANTPQQC